MCGRAAQTYASVEAAANSFDVPPPVRPPGAAATASDETGADATTTASQQASDAASTTKKNTLEEESWDNYNLSPGMEAFVFWKDSDTNQIQVSRKVWGLVRGGSRLSPLERSMNAHFSSLMFNARSDTLYTKPTFARLANKGQSCIVAVDGFFEWKAAPNKLSKKQPYFVHQARTNADTAEPGFLLLAGLWSRVSTGRDDDPTLDTFTILTMDASPCLSWLHTRMPVMVHDTALALKWLESPRPKLVEELVAAANDNSDDQTIGWHAVTTDMTSLKFRSKRALEAIKPMPTIASFFPKQEETKATSKTATGPSSKRVSSTTTTPSPAHKKPKKGSIQSFFSKKE